MPGGLPPTLSGYTTFIRNVMAIPIDVLPDDAPVVGDSFQAALDWVNPNLALVPSGSPSFPTIYARAVYNLAGDRLVNYAQDAPGAPNVEGAELPYFANLRATMKLGAFVAGAVSGTSDEGTSVSIAVPTAIAEGMTFDNLQNMKTPWGRTYLGIAQSFGPSVWGLTGL